MRSRHSEHGFALPLTLFVVALVTIILSGALVQVEVDRRVAESAADEVDVVAIAQSGLQTYLATTNLDGCYRARRPANGDSVRINLTGGYADVVAHVAQRPLVDTLAPWRYAVRATGRVIEPTMGADPRAARTVAQYADWSSGWMDGLGAFVAANGVVRNPSTGTGELRGGDLALSCRAAVARLRVAGAVPDLSYYNVDGNSPVGGYTSVNLANATNIDWAKTIGGGLVPDYNYVRTWDFSYPPPTMLVQGNATLGSAGGYDYGWGLLIVTGNLRVLGDYVQWWGVVLVGGKIDFDANSQLFDGMVVSGLNAQLGQAVPQGTIGGDYLDIDYDSSYLRLALHSLAGFGAVSNTWVENWASY